MLRLVPLLVAVGLVALSGCDTEDPIDPDPTPRSFTVTIENVDDATPVLKHAAFDTPVGTTAPGPLMPGQSYEATFTAGPGSRLSLATMFVQSNDLFYAFPGEGLPLFDGDVDAVTGDVTEELFLYDAGTEVNEEPGLGPNQAPRQPAPNTGPAENGVVALIPDGGTDAGGFSYPDKADVIRVSLDHDGGTTFTLTIENVSAGTTVNGEAIPLSPGVWAVHSDMFELYELGEPATEGIERIAEDGDPMAYDDALDAETGLTVPLSPGAWAVHTPSTSLYSVGEAASEGIERIAEDGNPMPLAQMLQGGSLAVTDFGTFMRPVGTDMDGPLMPGQRYSFEVEASPGQVLSFATMFVQSNDRFYGFADDGLALFDGSGTPTSGDVTAEVMLFDAGTEGNEEPGVGPFQAPRQPAPDTGPDGEGTITADSDDGFPFPPTASVIRVTIQPN